MKRDNAELHLTGAGDWDVDDTTVRGRRTDSRSLSRTSSSAIVSAHHRSRQSVTTRFADDSSGDEGGDVVRGLVASGGGAMFGGKVGLGISPASGRETGGGMDYDPVEELDARDLELPVAQDGLEVRVWTEALRVRCESEIKDPA